MEPTIAVSSWAVDRTLGVRYPDSPSKGPGPIETLRADSLPLMLLPGELKAHGYHKMQLCHFHLPSRDVGYAEDLRASLAASEVELLTVLIDEGDVSHPETGTRDATWAAGWMDTAKLLGAQRVRVIAGKQKPTEESLSMCVTRLRTLADHAANLGLRVEIENWFDLLAKPEQVLRVLQDLGGNVGLCLDFGNWQGAWKYDAFAEIFPFAETCHAKAEFLPNGEVDTVDYDRYLNLAKDAKFSGPFVLVSGGPTDSDWHGLALSRQAIQTQYGNTARG